eukprot:32727-Eustigmatos_ZCMA.PRE.1
MDKLRNLQNADPVMRGYIKYLQQGSLAAVDTNIRNLLIALDDYAVVDGILYHIMRLGHKRRADRRAPGRLQLMVPATL